MTCPPFKYVVAKVVYIAQPGLVLVNEPLVIPSRSRIWIRRRRRRNLRWCGRGTGCGYRSLSRFWLVPPRLTAGGRRVQKKGKE